MADCKTVFLSEIGDIVTGNTPKTSDEENYASNDIPFLKPSDFCNDSIDLENIEFFISEKARNKARILPVGSIAVTCIGIIGKTKVIHDECAFNQQINAIIPYDDNYNRYIAYAIAFQKELLQLQANSAVVPIINKTDFSKISIPLPPLETQRQIAANLDKVTHTIDLCNAILEKLDLLVKSRFVEMFGDPIVNDKNWTVALIGDNCFVTKLAGFEYTQYIHYEDDGDVVMVKAQNVKNGKLNDKDLSYISSDVSDSLPRSQLSSGDIVMTYVGANIGDVAVIDDRHRYHLAPNVAKIRPDSSVYNSNYFMYMLMFLNSYIVGNSADTAKAALGMERIRKLSVFIPPLALQQQYAAFVEQTDKSKLAVKQVLEKAETLKQALMQEYFG